MKKLIAIALLALLAGCSRQPSTPADNSSTSPNPASAPAPGAPGASSAAAPGAKQPAAPGKVAEMPAELPAGTVITIKLKNSVGSKLSQSGDRFEGTVAEPVDVNGKTVIPVDAPASGIVADAKPLGHFKGGALLRLRLESVNGYPVQATLSRSEKGKGKRTAVLAGGGGALGAIIGGIAGGGKGAAIGAAAGAGAGGGGAYFTGNKEITIPAESAVSFELAQAAPLKKR
jgi:hypothetical protein